MNPELLSWLPQILFQIGKAIGSGMSLRSPLGKAAFGLPGANLATTAEIADRMHMRLANKATTLDRPSARPVISERRMSASGAKLGGDESSKQLFKRVDQALYGADASGRTQSEIAPTR